MPDKVETVDKQEELGLKSDPYEDGVRLFLSWNAKHSPDTQLSQACANIIARMDGKAPIASDFLQVLAPPAIEQQHIGNGVYQGVEIKAEESLKVLPYLQNPIPQVGAKDPVGAPLPLQDNAPVLDTASVQPSSTSTAQPVEAATSQK